MSTELNIYKKNRINELIQNYNNNIRRLTNELNNNITIIKKSRQSLLIKNKLINALVKNYNNNQSILKKTFNQNKLSIQNFIPKNITLNKKKHALIIGINYTGTTSELYGCINDANSIETMIKNKGGFNSVNVITDLTNIKATKNNILNQLKNILQQTQAGDFIFLYYSGHGSYVLDKSNDEKTGYDQIIIPCDFEIILDDELKNIIRLYLKQNVTLFAMFDSCFSGTVLDLKYQYMDSLDYNNYSENNKQLETVGNVFMISGCTDYQTSLEVQINNKSAGLMTWSFLEALKQNPSGSWRELVKKMRDVLKTNNFVQLPQFSCGKFENFDSKIFI